MDLFDFSGGGNMGFGSVKNTRHFTDEDLFEELSHIKVSFGEPIMGDIYGTPAVMYKNATALYDIFARVHKDKIIMGKIGADGVSSVEAAAMMEADVMLDHKDEGTSKADRAVDELLRVIKKLENNETVTISDEAMPARTSTGEPVALYMEQKIFTIGPKFDVFDINKVPVYHVEGDITGHIFSIYRDGVEVLKLKKRIGKLLSEYIIEKDDEEIARLKTKFKLTNPQVSGSAFYEDLNICGDILGFDYDIRLGERTIAHIDSDSSKWVADAYRISIKDESMQDMIIALALICDNICDQGEIYRHR